MFGFFERDEKKRAQFQQEISMIDKNKLFFMDESGIDNNETYSRAWTPRGQRAYDMKPGNRTQRLSIIGSLNNNQFKAPFVFEGYCNSGVTQIYFEEILLPSIPTGSYIVLDNASFHKSSSLASIVKKFGCFLLFLPSYSPDFNPIEHFWSPLKNAIRKNLSLTNFDLFAAVDLTFNNSGPSL